MITAKVREAYDTEANWSSNNPILLSGQLAFQSDKYGFFKVGDGSQHWAQLPYYLDPEIQRLKTNGVFFKDENAVTIEAVDFESSMGAIVSAVLAELPDADVAQY